MKIASFKIEGFKVGWLLTSPAELRIRYPFEHVLKDHKGFQFSGVCGTLPEKSGPIIECILITPIGSGTGLAACSFEDKFSFGKGMKLSLEKAIFDAKISDLEGDKLKTKQLWDALLADGALGRAIRGEDERVIRNGIQDRIQGILYKIGS